MANELIPLEGPKVIAQPTQPLLYQEGRTIFQAPKVAVGGGIDLGAIGKAAAELGTQFVQMKQEQFFAEKQAALEKTTAVTQSKLSHYAKLNDIDNYTKTVEQYEKDVSSTLGIDPKSEKAPSGLAWQRMWTSTRVSLGKFQTDREILVTGAQEDQRIGALRTISNRFEYNTANAKNIEELQKIVEEYQQTLITINKSELGGGDDIFAEDATIRSPNDFQRKAIIQSEFAKAQEKLQKALGSIKPFDPKDIWNRGQAQLHAAHTYLDVAEKTSQSIVDQTKAGLDFNPQQRLDVAVNIVKLKQASLAAVEQVVDSLRTSGVISADQYNTMQQARESWLTPEGVAMLQSAGADDPFIEKMNKTVVFLATQQEASVLAAAKMMEAVASSTEKARTSFFTDTTNVTVNGIVNLETQLKQGGEDAHGIQVKAEALAEDHRKKLVAAFIGRWGGVISKAGLDPATVDLTDQEDVAAFLARAGAVAPDTVPQMFSEIGKISEQFTKVAEKLQQLYPAESRSSGGSGAATKEQRGRQLLNAAQQGVTTVTRDDFGNASTAVDLAFKDAGFAVSAEPNSLPVAAQMYAFLKAKPDAAFNLPYDLLMSSEYGAALLTAAVADYNQTATAETTETQSEFVGKFLKRFVNSTNGSPFTWGDVHRQAGVEFAADLPEKTAEAFINMLGDPLSDQTSMTAAMSLGTSKWRREIATKIEAKINTDSTLSEQRKTDLRIFAARLAEYDPTTHGDPFRAATQTPVITPAAAAALDALNVMVASGADEKRFNDTVLQFQDPRKLAAVSLAKFVRTNIPNTLAEINNPELNAALEDPVFKHLVHVQVAQRFKDYLQTVASNPERFTALLGEDSTVDRQAVLKSFGNHLKMEYSWDNSTKTFKPKDKDISIATIVAPDRTSVASSGVMHSTESTEAIALKQPLVYLPKNALSFFAQFGPVTPDMGVPQQGGKSVIETMVEVMDNNPMAAAIRLGVKETKDVIVGVTKTMDVRTAGGVIAAQMAFKELKRGNGETDQNFIARVSARGNEILQSIYDNAGGMVNTEEMPFSLSSGYAKAVTIRPNGLTGRPSAVYFLTDGTNRGDLRQTPEYRQSMENMPFSVFREGLKNTATTEQWEQQVIDWMVARPEEKVAVILDKDSSLSNTIELRKSVDSEGRTTIKYARLRRKLTARRFFGLDTDPGHQPWEVDQKWMGGPPDITTLFVGNAPPKKVKQADKPSGDVWAYSVGGMDMNADNYVSLLPTVMDGVFSPNMPEDSKIDTWKNLLVDIPEIVHSAPVEKKEELRNAIVEELQKRAAGKRYDNANLFESGVERLMDMPVPTKGTPNGYSQRSKDIAAEEARQWAGVGSGRQLDLIPPFFIAEEEEKLDLSIPLKVNEAIEAMSMLRTPYPAETYRRKRIAAEEARQWSGVGTGRRFNLFDSLTRDIPSFFTAEEETEAVAEPNVDNIKMLKTVKQAIDDVGFARYIKKYLGL